VAPSPYISIVALASDLTLSGGKTGLTGSPDLFSSAVRMISALAITLGIVVLIFYLLKRFFSKSEGALGSRGLIRVISTTYLGGKRSLVLADVAGEKLLLGLSPHAVTLLARIDSEEGLEKITDAEQGVQAGRPFLWYLESFMARHLGKRERTGVKE
jgi:flagellar protein FliO/FliZ